MKLKKTLFLGLSALALIGCSSNESSSDSVSSTPASDSDTSYSYTPQDISARDVSYPTEITYSGNVSFAIHYRRSDNKYADWGLWLWDPNGEDDSVVDTFNYQDDFGVTAYYDLSYIGPCEDGLGFIIRKLDSWTKDYDADRFFDFEAYNIDENNCYHLYLYSGDGNIYSTPNKEFADAVSLCEFSDEQTLTIEATNPIKSVSLYKETQTNLLTEYSDLNTTSFSEKLPDGESADIGYPYWANIVFKNSGFETLISVSVANLYKTDSFEQSYNYDGELGAIYTAEKTTFKVWSPVSSSISVRVYNSGTPKSVSEELGDDSYQEYEMAKGEKGVFSVDVAGDLAGKYYTYVVNNASFSDKEIVDPYAKSAGISGLRGMVVDFSKTNPTGWEDIDYLDYDRNELTVYEVHVADITSHSSWSGTESYRRKFRGMAESGTTLTYQGSTVTTGFDHIKETGVNAVQILPMFDQANDETTYTFNWGYNPLNYNVVEGMYSQDPYDGYSRIEDLKTLVMAYNQAGIEIIMDVVYNHVNGAAGSNFDVLMPDYYFRLNDDGSYSNGSGCGNETASEMHMMRKFMIDSASFWVEEYKLGGFRFDLMGLHDLTTMNELTAACKEINPNIVIYGEPWTGGTSSMENFESVSAKQSNGNKYEGYGQFNDAMRDALIKGGLNSAESLGWITNKDSVSSGDVLTIQRGIAGITYNSSVTIDDPSKTVNYVTCHDNYTIYDRIAAAGTLDTEFEQDMMCVAANGVVFTSQGTTFMQGGEEFLRSKKGDSNSYESGDAINQFNYRRKVTFAPVFEAYKGLINFKQTCSDLHAADSKVNVEKMDSGSILYYEVSDGSNTYMVVHANGYEPSTGRSSIDLSGYSVYFDTLSSWEGDYLQKGDNLSSYTMNDFETLIAIKN